MFRKKVWWALPLAIIALSAPRTVFSIERDPYELKTFIGKVYFEYEKETLSQTSLLSNSQTNQENSKFQQIYSLDMKGYVVSHRLIVYDANIALTRNDYTSGQKYKSDLLSYGLRTTLLPKSAIPLTLYGNITENTQSTIGGDSTHTGYGFNWFARLRTLPMTSVYFDRTDDKTQNNDLIQTKYRVNMVKNIGPTENELEFTGTMDDHTLSGASSSSSSEVLNLRNNTHISRSTLANVGATLGRDSSGGNHSTTRGLSLGVNSSPSSNFSQTHYYNYYSNDADIGNQTGNSYFGDLKYRFSDRLTSGFGLETEHTLDNTKSAGNKTDSVRGRGSISYVLSDRWSLGQSAGYSRTRTKSSGKEPIENKFISEMTTLNYRNRYNWATLTGHYGLGITRQDVSSQTNKQLLQTSQGTALTQNVGAGLMDINFNPYVGFDTFFDNTYNRNISGDVGGGNTKVHFGAFNKSLKEYFLAKASFDKESQSSWLSIVGQSSQSYRLEVSSNYFQATNLMAGADTTRAFNEKSGFSKYSSASLSVYHSREFWQGTLTGHAIYTLVQSSFPGNSDRTRTLGYGLTFQKDLTMNIYWQLTANMTESHSRLVTTKVTTIQNSIFYQLRAWTISGEYRYLMTKDNTLKQNDNYFNLKVTRTFVRILL